MAKRRDFQMYHDDLVNILYHHPEELHIDPSSILSKCREYAIYSNGLLLTEVDIHFQLFDRLLFYEVKSSNTMTCIRKGNEQLKKIHDWINYTHPQIYTECYLVYPKHKIEHRMNHLEDLIISKR